MKNIANKYWYKVALIISILCAITSCEDEVIDTVVEIPGDTVRVLGFNHIVSYEVSEFSPDTVLLAAIAEDSIIVYWPSYRNRPENISPAITVAEGATISPASGEKVLFQTGTSYTVTGEDQSERSYTLKVVIYQPEPVLGIDGVITFVPIADDNPIPLTFSGDHFIPDTARTNFSLVSWENGEEIPLKITDVTINLLSAEVPGDTPKGYYRTLLETGDRTLFKEDSIWVKIPEPIINWPISFPNPPQFSQGDTLDLTGQYLFDLERMEMLVSAGVTAPLEILDFTPNTISIKIPEDFPVGVYFFNQVNIYSPWGNNDGITFSQILLEVVASSE
ncbi:MAG: hypothetical protein AAGA02_01085 [Bacteroidota bacterium]